MSTSGDEKHSILEVANRWKYCPRSISTYPYYAYQTEQIHLVLIDRVDEWVLSWIINGESSYSEVSELQACMLLRMGEEELNEYIKTR